MNDAEQIERALFHAGMTANWTKREIGHDLTTETRVSNVTFVFDGADRLVRIETPEDRAKTEEEKAEDAAEDLRTQAREARVRRIRDAVLEAKKLVFSSEARGKLDHALELLLEVP